jgi:hypothetical protein
MSTYRKEYPEHWFVVDYTLDESLLHLTAWKIEELDEDGHEHGLAARPHLTGYIKWDGCTSFDFDSGIHFCGSGMMTQHCGLLREVFQEARTVFNDPDL